MQGPGKAGRAARRRPLSLSHVEASIAKGSSVLDSQKAMGLSEPPSTFRDIKALPESIPKKSLKQFTAYSKPNSIIHFLEKLFGVAEPSWPEDIEFSAGDAGTFKLDSRILPEMPGATGAQKKALVKGVAEKVQRGYNLVKGLNDGRIDREATIQDISDILWFVQARAEQKVGSFDSGTTFMEDIDSKLLAFFDSCPQSYQRISSHMPEFQKNDVHRGIDFDHGGPNNLDELLPHDKTTVLYFPLAKGSDPAALDKMPKGMIFIKMEEHGAAAYKPKGGYKAKGPQSRGVGIHDYLKALGHGWGYIQSKYRKFLGKTSGSRMRRERVPAKVQKEYKALIKSFRQEGFNKMAGILENNNPTKHGIRHMLLQINQAVKESRAGAVIMSDAVGKLLKMQEKLSALDHSDLRVGEEAIITADELKA